MATEQKKDDKKDQKGDPKDLLPTEELNEEDQALKEKLELCVERLGDSNKTLAKQSADMIKTEVSGATSSMSSIPKPLKFMSPMYEKVKEKYNAYKMVDQFKKELSDLCSVIAMVAAPEGSLEMLEFCMTGTMKNLETWGHEYLRALAGQVGTQYDNCVADSKDTTELMGLVDIIIPVFIHHNEEPEAVDLMMETESLSKLTNFCTDRNFDRVCRYLCSCSQFAADTEEMVQSYTTAYQIYKQHNQFPDALRVA